MFSLRIDHGLELRLLGEQQAEILFALVDENRDHLRQWLPWLDDNRSVDDTRAFIKKSLEQLANNNGFPAGIWYQGRLAGVIGYAEIDWPNRITGIGYWLGASFQGQGLVTRSCRALVDYAFNQLELNRVEIRCAPGNKASCAIPQRLGFTREGVLRQAEWLYDHYVDLVVYAMLASEWPAAVKQSS